MRGLIALVLAAAIFPLGAASAADEEVVSDFLACEPLSVPSQRLLCFESVLKQHKLRLGLLPPEAVQSNLPSSGAVRSAPTVLGAAPAVPRQQEADSPERGRREAPVASQFAKADEARVPDRFTAQVERVWVHGHRTYVALDNDTVWRDTDGRDLLVVEDDSVEVYKGFMGGYRMKPSSSGAVATVRRVR